MNPFIFIIPLWKSRFYMVSLHINFWLESVRRFQVNFITICFYCSEDFGLPKALPIMPKFPWKCGVSMSLCWHLIISLRVLKVGSWKVVKTILMNEHFCLLENVHRIVGIFEYVRYRNATLETDIGDQTPNQFTPWSLNLTPKTVKIKVSVSLYYLALWQITIAEMD